MNLVNKVRHTIRKYSLLERGDRVVVGVSGGPDSMALLHVLCGLREEYGLTLIPAHLNHGFRGQEALDDLDFCREAASRYGLSLESESVDLPGIIRRNGLSPQVAAREVRYGFLVRTAERHGASKIALGHQANDQAETFLMRLLRGAGPKGLRGIPIQRAPGIVRPLLYVTRDEILSCLEEKGIRYREDSSNQKDVYLRNRVRRELFPLLLEKYNPNLVADLQRTAEILGEEDEFLEAEARRHFDSIREAEGVCLALSRLCILHPVLIRRIVRLAIAFAEPSLSGPSFNHVGSVLRLMQAQGSSGSIDLPHGLRVHKVYDRLEFSRRPESSEPAGRHEIPIPGRERIPALSIEVESRILGPGAVQGAGAENAAMFDLDKCALPLWVRTRESGDVFYPQGFGRRKKVKRFFIDEKVPYPERSRVPLVVDRQDRILWVGGYRADERFAADAGTSRALLLRIRRLQGKEDRSAR